MENLPTMIGSKGLIKRHEFVRILIQCLYSLGYEKSAACLELESGISCKSSEFKSLESLGDAALFLVCQQFLLECSGRGDDLLALSVLPHDGVDVFQDLREKLINELEKLLPPPMTLPDRRLEYLVDTVVGSQIDSCIYHNSLDPVSIYKDHRCGRDQIPTETVQILSAHKNEVWFVQFSNNGNYLASSSSDCTAIIWKVQEDCKLALKHILSSHENPVSFVAWSPDDTMLLTCGSSEVLRLWDVETGICKHTFGDSAFHVSSCAWFPDSKRLVCGSADPKKGICMWDCEGNEIKAWRGGRMPKVTDIAVTPNGENLISVFSDRDIRILNVDTNTERVISEEHPITSLSVSDDNKYLIVNLNSQEIHMWDVEGSWEKPLTYKGHRQEQYVIRSCFGGVNGTFIASGSENFQTASSNCINHPPLCNQVYIWNRRSSDPIEVLSGHKKTVNCVSWNPKRHQMLASASDDQTIRIWGPNRSEKDAC
ncbi:WD repeat-containing protein WDS [Tanacetum coccineum]